MRDHLRRSWRVALAACLGATIFGSALAQEATKAPSSDAIAGWWRLSFLRPGVVEIQTVRLQVHPGSGNAITAEVSIPGRGVPFEGTFDPATGEIALEAGDGDKVATVSLVLADGQLRGEGSLGEGPVTFQGRRMEEPPPPPAVDFTVPRPMESATGALPPSFAETCRTLIEEFMDAQTVVGISAAFVVNNQVIDVLSFGWEDFAKRVPASEHTMYRWASVVKPLTAVAALQLAAAGDFDLDADIRALTPEYDKGVSMSARQLLAHRAGVPHYDDMKIRTIKEYDTEHPWADRIVSLDMFLESDLVAAPGSRFRYSTPGYVLLGAVVERAGHRSYADQVIERICKPLAMSTMRPDYIWEDIPHRAAAYQHFAGGIALQTTPDDISWKLPAGGWISTAGDLGRFAAGLMGPKLLDDETKQLMWGLPGDADQGYAMGITVRRLDGRPVLSHSGGQIGVTTYFVCCPETGHAVAMMANTEGVRHFGDLAVRLLTLLIDSEP